MGGRKSFMLRIEIDIHSVHYKDIKLCQSGNVALRVHTLSSTAVTMPARPFFPIHFHEKLIFEKVIERVTNLAEIQDHLNRECVKMELVQWPRHYLVRPTIISQFRTKLSALLFPALVPQDLSHGGDTELLMEPTEKFSGTSGANVEVSTNLVVAETATCNAIRIPEQVPHTTCHNYHHMQPKKTYNYCRHNIKCQLPTCGCLTTDHCRIKPGSRHKKLNHTWIKIHETASCNDCCICNCYSGYFDPKPYLGHRSRSCSCIKTCDDSHTPKARKNEFAHLSPTGSSSGSYSPNFNLTSVGIENPISYQQLFYENLDLFYKKLRDKKYNDNRF